MIILIVIIALSLLIFVHELGHFLIAKAVGMRVDEFGIGFPPRVFYKKIGETKYSLNALPLGGFVRIHGEDPTETEEEGGEPERSFGYQESWKKIVVVLAGVFMNIVFGWFLLSIVFMVGVPERLVISQVASGSPAYESGLRMGDTIVSAERPGAFLEDPVNAGSFVEFVKESPGEIFLLTVQRGGELLGVEVFGRLSPPKGEGSLGIGVLDAGLQQRGFFTAIRESLSATLSMLAAIVAAFAGLIAGLFTSSEIMEDLAGPVGIFVLARDAGTLGLIYLVQLTAIISLNLAVLNLIPFPALDGGRFVMIIAEKIKGSPISRNIQAGINAFGLIALLILMVFVTIQDVGKFF